MSSAKITLRGFMDYCEADGVDLFGGLMLPEGIEKDLVCNNILMRGGEFEVLYSSPDTMISLIAYWARRHYRTFDKWIKALNVEYEPLYNYDRTEEWTDTGSDNGKEKRTGGSNITDSNKRTDNLTRTDNLKDNSSLQNRTDVDSDVENKRSAFDVSNYQPHDKTETSSTSESKDSGEITHTGNVKNTGSVEETGTKKLSDHDESEHERDTLSKHSGRMYGNIGVTTSQQMLEAELKIDKWNLYDHITDLFLQEFTIPVYI